MKVFTEPKNDKQVKDCRKEYILCAANHYDTKDKELIKNQEWIRNRGISPYNIEQGIVLCGWRHPCIIAQMNALVGLRQCEVYEVQGFLTSKNRFVDRKEAGVIAFEAGQTETLTTFLYSEDIY